MVLAVLKSRYGRTVKFTDMIVAKCRDGQRR